MRLQSLRLRTALIAPVRLVLGVGWLVAALLAGAASGPTVAAFAVGAALIAFAAFNDPRARFLRREPQPLPGDRRHALDPAWRHVLSAAFPSTAGLSVLAAIAVAVQPLLAALIGGAAAGLGVAAAATARTLDPELLVDPRTGSVYRR